MMQNSGSSMWSSKTPFLMTAIGLAVGLGNLWRFPFIAGENGGAAFVLIYIACIFLLGFPVMMAELAIGRHGGHSARKTINLLVKQSGVSKAWNSIGWMSVVIPFVGMSYYAVVTGWTLDYLLSAVSGRISNLDSAGSGAAFDGMLASVTRLVSAHTVIMAGTIWILSRGLRGGLERAARFLLPTLFVFLLIMVGIAAVYGDFGRAFSFLFAPDFSKVTPSLIYLAVGQALFSIAIGLGALITFGAYLPKDISIPRSALTICAADTLVALVAGLAIFPLVFGFNLDAGEGPGLIFVTLPIAFSQVPAGEVVSIVFFTLLFLAAFTTCLGTMEPVVAWAEDTFPVSRAKLAIIVGFLIWLLGLLPVLSFNVFADVRPLASIEYFADKGIFDLFDYFIANLLLPLNVMVTALFAGWAFSPVVAQEELGFSPTTMTVWRWILRFFAPAALVWIMYGSLMPS